MEPFDTYKELDALLAEMNQPIIDTQIPPEPVGVWFPASQPPTVADHQYLVHVVRQGRDEFRAGWYNVLPAAPWTTTSRSVWTPVAVRSATRWLVPGSPFIGDYLRFTGEGCQQYTLIHETERQIIKALDMQPDEGIIVTVSKRKKQL